MRTLFTTSGRKESADLAQIVECLTQADQVGFWLDIEAPVDDDFRLLQQTFKFHPLTIENIQHHDIRPKVDEYSDYNFVVTFQADWAGDEAAFRSHYLYIGPRFLVSVHDAPSPALAGLQQRIEQRPDLTRGQPAFLTYLIQDALVDATFPILDQLDEAVDSLEDDITAKASPESLKTVYRLKHAVTEIRRMLAAERDVFQSLITHGIHLQQADMTLYYRDVYDHIVRQYETVDSLRDLLTSAMDVYLSTVSTRLNQTTKTLTVIASLFLPLSFLTGFYGMNFSFLTGVLETPYASFAVGIGTMLIATAIQLYLFRRRGWI